MINSNFSSLTIQQPTVHSAKSNVSLSKQTFKAILAELKAQPLKPLSVQRFAGKASRSLAQQIHSDTAAVF